MQMECVAVVSQYEAQQSFNARIADHHEFKIHQHETAKKQLFQPVRPQ